MRNAIKKKTALVLVLFTIALMAKKSINALEDDGGLQPMVVPQFIEEARKNSNWKTAFATGKDEQIVFMNVSPFTNPNNEIGLEVHSFDQVILIVEGKGKAILNGKTSPIKDGDMIFIPQRTAHNIINLDTKKAMKLISFYSATDIPKGAVYKTKADQPED